MLFSRTSSLDLGRSRAVVVLASTTTSCMLWSCTWGPPWPPDTTRPTFGPPTRPWSRNTFGAAGGRHIRSQTVRTGPHPWGEAPHQLAPTTAATRNHPSKTVTRPLSMEMADPKVRKSWLWHIVSLYAPHRYVLWSQSILQVLWSTSSVAPKLEVQVTQPCHHLHLARHGLKSTLFCLLISPLTSWYLFSLPYKISH